MPSENIIIKGSLKANTYFATLIVDNQTYDEIPYTYGQESIDLPDVPSKSGYSGSWSEYSLEIDGTTITAIYTPNSHTVIWMIDGIKYTETTESYNNEIQVLSLSWGDPLEEEMETHSSILAWGIPWTEEPGGLPIGSQKVRHD